MVHIFKNLKKVLKTAGLDDPPSVSRLFLFSNKTDTPVTNASLSASPTSYRLSSTIPLVVD